MATPDQDPRRETAENNALDRINLSALILVSTETEVLDSRGDLKLQNGNRVFLVSSNVLMLASPYFQAMLQPDKFAEGMEQPQVACRPTKILNDSDEDIESFATMCRILHLQKVAAPSTLEQLNLLAKVCRYYGTARAVAVYVQRWVRPFEIKLPSLEASDVYCLLFVAMVFQLEDTFSILSRELAAAADANDEDAGLSESPSTRLHIDIAKLRGEMNRHIRNEIEDAVDNVRISNESFAQTEHKLCITCRGRKPLVTKKCGHCGSREFCVGKCEQEGRLKLFLDWLDGRGLWPTKSREKSSCKRLLQALTQSSLYGPYSKPHTCSGKEKCPLEMAKKQTIEAIREAPRAVKGLDIHDYAVEAH